MDVSKGFEDDVLDVLPGRKVSLASNLVRLATLESDPFPSPRLSHRRSWTTSETPSYFISLSHALRIPSSIATKRNPPAFSLRSIRGWLTCRTSTCHSNGSDKLVGRDRTKRKKGRGFCGNRRRSFDLPRFVQASFLPFSSHLSSPALLPTSPSEKRKDQRVSERV